MSVDYPTCSSSGAAICVWNSLQIVAPGYFCEHSTCLKCPIGTYGSNGRKCIQCPYATWTDLIGSTSCQKSFAFSKPGVQKIFIPYGVNKINVKLWGGGGGSGGEGEGDQAVVFNENTAVSKLGSGGGFSTCNVSVTANEYVYIIVASGGRASSDKYIENLGGRCVSYLQLYSCQQF